MKLAILRKALVFAVGVLGIAFAGAPAPTTVPTPPSSSVIHQRIDALLKRRLRPEPLPANLANPFQVSPKATREGAPEEGKVRPAGDLDGAAPASAPNQSKLVVMPNPVEVLASVSARFKIGGVITLKDQLQVVINGVPRREGESVAGDFNGGVIVLKIVRLTAGQMSLRYGDAEITIKF